MKRLEEFLWAVREVIVMEVDENDRQSNNEGT